MKRAIQLIILISLSCHLPGQDHFEIPSRVKRIVFLGNSITYRGLYVSYVETYLTLKYPEKQFEYINLGLPSENVSGLSEPGHANGQFPRPDLHERLDRVLEMLEPDLVFACYGMNDVIYQPFDDSRFQKFRDGIRWMHDKVKGTGAMIVHLTPPVYDPRKRNILTMFWISIPTG